uniref:NADH-ubiquinone oxidoreductase chain 3 n=1 Tax=Rectidens sumatrensis TaxID=1903498 RepID=A0A8A3WJ25_9BIVA|nr:NADH dehydrogenase subunit 3 [Rectidens sumatrensis]
MKAVFVSVSFGLLVSLVMVGFGSILSYRGSMAVREISSPFECGFDPVGSSRTGFSLRFFGLMILFVVFDFETVLVMPVVVWLMMGLVSWLSVFGFVLFMFMLFLGVMYELKEGILEWVL